MILRAIKPEHHEKAVQWLQAAALFAFCIGALLPKFFDDSIAVSLLSGVALGFSIVGNLLCLNHRRNKKNGAA